METLTPAELDSIRRCVEAILHGPFIDDPEFQTRLGVDRDAFRRLIANWPPDLLAQSNSEVHLVLNNALNEICHGVRISDPEWARWFGAGLLRTDILAVYRKWAEATGSRMGLR